MSTVPSESIGPDLCIDESSLSRSGPYTFVTNPDGHGGKGGLVAVIEGTVEKLLGEQFVTVLDTFHNHYDTIRNFFEKRSTNAFAGSSNTKVEAFRAQFHGVTDIPFFLCRLPKLCA